MERSDFKVGQKVFIEPYEHSRDREMRDGEVVKVGRKYITIKERYCETRFNIDDGLEFTEIGGKSTLYLDKQHILDKLDAASLSRVISSNFNYGRSKLPLRKLIKIKEIIDSE